MVVGQSPGTQTVPYNSWFLDGYSSNRLTGFDSSPERFLVFLWASGENSQDQYVVSHRQIQTLYWNTQKYNSNYDIMFHHLPPTSENLNQEPHVMLFTWGKKTQFPPVKHQFDEVPLSKTNLELMYICIYVLLGWLQQFEHKSELYWSIFLW